jgi:hypothetical protein
MECTFGVHEAIITNPHLTECEESELVVKRITKTLYLHCDGINGELTVCLNILNEVI